MGSPLRRNIFNFLLLERLTCTLDMVQFSHHIEMGTDRGWHVMRNKSYFIYTGMDRIRKGTDHICLG